jgi:hypothetical protein
MRVGGINGADVDSKEVFFIEIAHGKWCGNCERRERERFLEGCF